MHNDLTLKQLETLRDKGVLSEIEFATKKAEFVRSINSSHEAKSPSVISQFMGLIGYIVLIGGIFIALIFFGVI